MVPALNSGSPIQVAYARALGYAAPRHDGRDPARPMVYGRRTLAGWVYCVAVSESAKAWVRARAPRSR